jgi:hypothetical protein
MKHTKGKLKRWMTIFGYKFEIYENVVLIYDNEDETKYVEMQHHTFESFFEYYIKYK